MELGKEMQGLYVTAAEFFGTIAAYSLFSSFNQTSQTAPGREERDPRWEPH